MAYDFFPKTERELTAKIKGFPFDNQQEIVRLFNFLKKKYRSLDAPINLDLKKPSNVNVTRQLDGDIKTADISKGAGLSKVKIKFGNGSSGNRGAKNRGNLFEEQFANGLLKWWAGEAVDGSMRKAIDDLDKTYDLSDSKKFVVKIEGGENTKRPLQFDSGIYLANPKGKGNDVGKSVTDITLETDKGPIYLSLKLGGTTTFFNVGVRTILTPQEIQKGQITNQKGLALLNLFGVDQEKFCKIFTGDLPGGEVVRNAPYSKPAMKKLLESGIGYNYHIIHKFPGRILSKKMDQTAMQRAAKTGDLTIFYGGKTGTGKRIDMEFASSTYSFKINIRDTQGKDGFPTRMMCDFKYV